MPDPSLGPGDDVAARVLVIDDDEPFVELPARVLDARAHQVALTWDGAARGPRLERWKDESARSLGTMQE